MIIGLSHKFLSLSLSLLGPKTKYPQISRLEDAVRCAVCLARSIRIGTHQISRESEDVLSGMPPASVDFFFLAFWWDHNNRNQT